jgi:hypothetical protein
MTASAVIVGVDDYAQQPLTSAIHDALAFRDELVSLVLVQPTKLRLLTSPVLKGSAVADSRNIDRTTSTTTGDRRPPFVFFAGHGLLAPTDAARSIFQTAFVPVDIVDLHDDSRLLSKVRLKATGTRTSSEPEDPPGGGDTDPLGPASRTGPERRSSKRESAVNVDVM